MSEALRKATYADLQGLPEGTTGEIIAGELYVSPRPAYRHASTATNAAWALAPAGRRGGGAPGGWIILLEPELHLGEDVLVPDMAGWRRTRMPEVPDVTATDLPPDWICEILSPRTARFDRIKKMDAYRRHHVEWAWLVDPIAESVEVYTLSSGRWMVEGTFGGDDHVRMPPFEQIEIDLSEWWLRPTTAP